MIAAVMQWPRVRNTIEVRSFLGFPGYYRRFVQNFSKIRTPLPNLTRKTTKYDGLTSARKPFKSLRRD